MESIMKKNYSNAFKFKAALEMIKGDLTIPELISKYQVSKSALHKWKNYLLENGAEFFNDKLAKPAQEPVDLDSLHATIGKLKVENDFLLKAYAKLK